MNKEAYAACKNVVLETLKFTCHQAEKENPLEAIKIAEAAISQSGISASLMNLSELEYAINNMQFDGTVNEVRDAMSTFEKSFEEEGID